MQQLEQNHFLDACREAFVMGEKISAKKDGRSFDEEAVAESWKAPDYVGTLNETINGYLTQRARRGHLTVGSDGRFVKNRGQLPFPRVDSLNRVSGDDVASCIFGRLPGLILWLCFPTAPRSPSCSS